MGKLLNYKLIAFLFLPNLTFGQQSCGLNFTNPNLLLTKYIPNSISTPVKTIPISFHVWRKNDGTGNYWQDIQAYRDTLRMVVGFLSEQYSVNWNPSDPIPNAQFISDTKVRFVLDTIYYYNNTYFATLFLPHGACTQYVKSNFPERLKSFPYHLNIWNDTTSPALGSSSGVCSPDQDVGTMRQVAERYLDSGLDKFWGLANHMAHEFGHNFNLGHPYDSEITYIYDPEFLWDLFGTQRQSWCTSVDINHVCFHDASFSLNPYINTNTATNNIMGGCRYDNRHITALQCGRIHRALAVSAIRNYA
ncbi:MAG: hypothetical protein WCP69_04275 [Bacteroidota bacterium]